MKLYAIWHLVGSKWDAVGPDDLKKYPNRDAALKAHNGSEGQQNYGAVKVRLIK